MNSYYMTLYVYMLYVCNKKKNTHAQMKITVLSRSNTKRIFGSLQQH